jgi:hypothetical protein
MILSAMSGRFRIVDACVDDGDLPHQIEWQPIYKQHILYKLSEQKRILENLRHGFMCVSSCKLTCFLNLKKNHPEMGGRRDNRQHTHTHVNKTDKTMMM